MFGIKKLFTAKHVYILIFLSLAGWSFFAYYTMSQLIHNQKVYAKLINLSGKQRMLSQKTTLMVKRVYESNDKKLINHLKELIELMKKEHGFLIENLTSKHMNSIYFEDPHDLNNEICMAISFQNKLFRILLQQL